MKTTVRIKPEEVLTDLISEVKSILVETQYSLQQTVIQRYHELGSTFIRYKAVLDSLEEKTATKDIVLMLAQAVGQSERTIYFAIAFASKYPNLEMLPAEHQGKNSSFARIKSDLLSEVPASKRDPKVYYCPKCGHFGEAKEFSGNKKMKVKA